MDELIVSGKKYISSKRAHELTGYAKDYVGQLARSGKIVGVRMGRAWYVDEASLMKHVGQETPPQSKAAEAAPLRPKLSASLYKPYALPSTWSQIRYLEDARELLPVVTKDPANTSELTNQNIAISAASPIKSEENNVTNIHISTPRTIHARRSESHSTRVFDIPRPAPRQIPTAPRPLRSVHSVRSVQKRPEMSLMPLALLTTGSMVSLFVGIGLAGGFSAPLENVQTASAITAVQDFLGSIWNSDLFQIGVTTLTDFIRILLNSFSSFLQAGIDFLKTL